MMRAIRRCGFILLMWAPLMSHAGTISTTEIVSQTTSAALSCMRWMPVGMFHLRMRCRDLHQSWPLPARCGGE